MHGFARFLNVFHYLNYYFDWNFIHQNNCKIWLENLRFTKSLLQHNQFFWRHCGKKHCLKIYSLTFHSDSLVLVWKHQLSFDYLHYWIHSNLSLEFLVFWEQYCYYCYCFHCYYYFVRYLKFLRQVFDFLERFLGMLCSIFSFQIILIQFCVVVLNEATVNLPLVLFVVLQMRCTSVCICSVVQNDNLLFHPTAAKYSMNQIK